MPEEAHTVPIQSELDRIHNERVDNRAMSGFRAFAPCAPLNSLTDNNNPFIGAGDDSVDALRSAVGDNAHQHARQVRLERAMRPDLEPELRNVFSNTFGVTRRLFDMHDKRVVVVIKRRTLADMDRQQFLDWLIGELGGDINLGNEFVMRTRQRNNMLAHTLTFFQKTSAKHWREGQMNPLERWMRGIFLNRVEIPHVPEFVFAGEEV